MKINKTMLIIMDGWGIGQVPEADAIAQANTPFVDSLYGKYPHSTLITCGEDVGLPDGQMGNSEVGHLNLGAGRIVYQELQRINVAIRTGELKKNDTLQNTFNYVTQNDKALHFIGLVSDGGVHASLEHLTALVQYAHDANVSKIYIHAFTDGRDTDPKSAIGYIHTLQQAIANTSATIASITGRYYAMDRDKRWERVQKAYEALTLGKGNKTENIINAIENSYKENITDEFIAPIIHCDKAGTPLAIINEGDAVICFNFRTDRCREISEVLTQKSIPEFGMKPLGIHYITMTEYDTTFKNVGVLFTKDNLSKTLGEVIEDNGLQQIRIAETEKYPHVSFFFSGGREQPFKEEHRIMIPSSKEVPTYDLKPEMSAYEITAAILPEIQKESAHFICLNFANTDMVGHTGVWTAAQKAAETVDVCVSQIIPEALAHNYTIFLTADHGNSDFLINEDGSSNTAHSLNPVPLIVISNDYQGGVKNGKLGDIAPSILSRMGLAIPKEMTGDILLDS
jgi:2,3-bisphosphoglycerate-independent phosphoglycerate mutase